MCPYFGRQISSYPASLTATKNFIKSPRLLGKGEISNTLLSGGAYLTSSRRTSKPTELPDRASYNVTCNPFRNHNLLSSSLYTSDNTRAGLWPTSKMYSKCQPCLVLESGSSKILFSTSITNVRLDDILAQASKNLCLSTTAIPTLPLERVTTISNALSVVASALVGTELDKMICLSGDEERRQRQHLLRAAKLQQSPASSDPRILAVLTQPRVGPLPDPVPASPVIRDCLRKAALSAPHPSNGCFLTLNSPIADAKLVSVSSKMVAHSLEEGPASVVFTPPLTLWDTASNSCQITEDCLAKDFVEYIRDPVNAFPGKVQVDATIELTRDVFSMSFLAFVVPAGALPNNFKGVLLGQYTFLDQLHYEMVPRKLLQAFGIPAADDTWGIIKIHTLLQPDGSMRSFADPDEDGKDALPSVEPTGCLKDL